MNEIIKSGGTLEKRVNHTKLAEVALLVWCGSMSFIGSIFLAINEPGLVFAGTLIGGGMIIIALFTNVEDLYLVWSDPVKFEKKDDPTVKIINLDECEDCKFDFETDSSMGDD